MHRPEDRNDSVYTCLSCLLDCGISEGGDHVFYKIAALGGNGEVGRALFLALPLSLVLTLDYI